MLITNGVRYGSGPMRYEGGQNAASIDRGLSMGQTPAGYLNFNHGEATAGSAAPAFGIPHGARHPATWMMGEIGGGIKSFRLGNLQIDASAVGEKGFPRTGSATITLDGAAAAGLIVSATGTSVITIDGTAAIVATVGTTGSVTVTIDGSAALGAEASLTGTGTVAIDGVAVIMGLGYMTGTTEESGLTPAGIARSVWSALATANNDPGTMGAKLNTASSGGVDLNAMAAAVWAYATRDLPASEYEAMAAAILAAAQATPIHSDTRKINNVQVTGYGVPGDSWRPL